MLRFDRVVLQEYIIIDIKSTRMTDDISRMKTAFKRFMEYEGKTSIDSLVITNAHHYDHIQFNDLVQTYLKPFTKAWKFVKSLEKWYKPRQGINRPSNQMIQDLIKLSEQITGSKKLGISLCYFMDREDEIIKLQQKLNLIKFPIFKQPVPIDEIGRVLVYRYNVYEAFLRSNGSQIQNKYPSIEDQKLSGLYKVAIENKKQPFPLAEQMKNIESYRKNFFHNELISSIETKLSTFNYKIPNFINIKQTVQRVKIVSDQLFRFQGLSDKINQYLKKVDRQVKSSKQLPSDYEITPSSYLSSSSKQVDPIIISIKDSFSLLISKARQREQGLKNQTKSSNIQSCGVSYSDLTSLVSEIYDKITNSSERNLSGLLQKIEYLRKRLSGGTINHNTLKNNGVGSNTLQETLQKQLLNAKNANNLKDAQYAKLDRLHQQLKITHKQLVEKYNKKYHYPVQPQSKILQMMSVKQKQEEKKHLLYTQCLSTSMNATKTMNTQQQQHDKIKEQLMSFQNQNIKLNDNLQQKDIQLKKQKNTVIQLKKKIEQIQTNISSLRNDYEMILRQKKERQNQLGQLQIQNKSLLADLKQNQTKNISNIEVIQQLRKEILNLQEKNIKVQIDYSALIEQRDKLIPKSQISNLDKKIQDANRQIQELILTKKNLQNQLKEQKKSEDQTNKRYQQIERQLKDIQIQMSQQKSELLEQRTKNLQKQNIIRQLTQQLDGLKYSAQNESEKNQNLKTMQQNLREQVINKQKMIEQKQLQLEKLNNLHLIRQKDLIHEFNRKIQQKQNESHTYLKKKEQIQIQFSKLLGQFQDNQKCLTTYKSNSQRLSIKIEELNHQIQIKQSQIQQFKAINNKINAQKTQLEDMLKLMESQTTSASTNKSYSQSSVPLIPYTELLFNQNIFFQDPKNKQILIHHIERYAKGCKIKRTLLLYKYDPRNKNNVHMYIDDIKNLTLIVKTKNAIIAGFYPGEHKDKEILNKGGLLVSVTNNQSYTLFDKKPGVANIRGMTYDQFFVIYGNAEIRIKSGLKTVFSNFGVNNAFYNSRGHKVDRFLNEADKREVEFESIQFYQTIFEEEPMEYLKEIV